VSHPYVRAGSLKKILSQLKKDSFESPVVALQKDIHYVTKKWKR